MRLRFIAGAKYKGKIYFSAMGMNGLFSYDLATDKVAFLKLFSKEKVRRFLHIEAILVKNEMWLVPIEGDNIACVDLDTLEISYFPIPGRKLIEKKYAFIGSVRVGDCLYLMPYCYDGVLRVNVRTKIVDKVCTFDFSMCDWARGGYIKDGKLILLNIDGVCGLSVDMDNGKSVRQREKIELYEESFFSELFGDELWVVPYRGASIKRIDILSEKSNTFSLPAPEHRFYKGMDIGEYVVFFPTFLTRAFLVIRKENNETRIIDECFEKARLDDQVFYEFRTIPADDGFWCASSFGEIFEFDEKGDVVSKHYAFMDEGELKGMLNEVYLRNHMNVDWFDEQLITESKCVGNLEDFIREKV